MFGGKVMFAYIKGSLEEKANGYVVIDVGGIGYKIFMSDVAIQNIGEKGNIVTNLHVARPWFYFKRRIDDV